MRLLSLVQLVCVVHIAEAHLMKPRSLTGHPSKTVYERAILAIVPTTAGQIGVSPVESDLGDPNTYIGQVYGTDTNYITVIDATTKWIGVNTEYLTIKGTSTIQIVVATAAAAANGQNIGDISLLLSEELASALQSSAETAINACGVLAAKKTLRGADVKRQADSGILACLYDAARTDAEANGLIESLVQDELLWETTGITVAKDASASLIDFVAGLTATGGNAVVQRFLLALASYVIVANVLLNNGVLEGLITGKVNFPHSGFATPDKNRGCTGLEPLVVDSLVCEDPQCQGDDTGLCTYPPNVDCPCLIGIPPGPQPQIIPFEWETFQQQFISNLLAASPPVGNGPCVPVGSAFPSDLMLRILPIGASIMFGYASTDKNGFRASLRSQLVANGASVNFVGELQSGTMVDNDVSGFVGARLDQIGKPLENALPWLPNLILVNIGSNDAGQGYLMDTYNVRLAAFLDRIITALPQTVILLSNILPNRTPETEAKVTIINAQFAAVVQERLNQGALIHFVDMHSLMSLSDINPADGTHPTDSGYIKMAGIWYSAIQQVFAQCWLTPPGFVASIDDTVPVVVDDTTCEKVPGNTIGPITIQKGSGSDDGVYTHLGEGKGLANIDLPSNGLGYAPLQVYWADINGVRTQTLLESPQGSLRNQGESANIGTQDGIDDFVYLYTSRQSLGVALSDGSGADGFGGVGGYMNYAIPMNCVGRPWFKDIDGDGRDDFICVDAYGILSAWQNTPGPDPRQPTGLLVELADIDGDGKVDYLTIDSDGSYTAWRNGGVGVPTYWQGLGVVFNESAGLDWIKLRLTDINGDGRDDVVWVSDAGEVTTWTNLRGESLSSLAPVWRAAGITHFGDPIITSNRGFVVFGNVKGHKEWVTYPNYQGIGNDYTAVYTIGPSNAAQLRINLWFNAGTGGGTRQAGDGDRYCDMRGTGADDYVWMAKDGTLTLFGNYHAPPNWKQYDVVFTPGALMVGHTRKDLHLADLNGDGRCDFLIVDKDSGSVHMIRNDYSAATDKFAWTDMGIVFNGGGCKNHYGVGLFDMGVRFADITGNGFPDYLCIDPNGRTDAWINNKMVFTAMGQAKASVGADRANLRWADINGDGRADLIWIDKFLGTYQVFSNGGPGDPANNVGSHIHWDARGFSGGGGNLRGECQDFSDLNGDGRADLTVIYPKTSVAYVYWNLCPGSGHPPLMTILPALPGTQCGSNC